MDDKIEQMNKNKKRMKQIEHKKMVDKHVQEKLEMLQKQLETENAAKLKEKEIEQYKEKVIEQERQRLLLEHATKLVGFLPKGVLRDKDDLELFDKEFKERFEIN